MVIQQQHWHLFLVGVAAIVGATIAVKGDSNSCCKNNNGSSSSRSENMHVYMQRAGNSWLLCTLQGELFGQLGCDVHAILQPCQLRTGNTLSVAAQAGSDARLPRLALWVHSDDWRNWNKEERSRGSQLRQRNNNKKNKVHPTMLFTLMPLEEWRQSYWQGVWKKMPSPEPMVWH